MPIAEAEPIVIRPSTLPSAADAKASQRYVYLDVMRALAVLLVLGAHYPLRVPEETLAYGFFDLWRRIGWIGVDLFFVLSGFLVGGLLFAEQKRHGRINYGRFLIRRTFKIWPSYLAVLFAVVAWDVIKGHGSWSQRLGDTAGRAWPYLLQIQNYYGPLVDRIGHLWSLAVEEHFYLLLPILLAAMAWYTARRSRKSSRPASRQPFAAVPLVFVVTLIVSLVMRIVQWRVHPQFDEFTNHWPTHLRIDSLMAGVALAWAIHYAREKVEVLRPWRWAIFAASLACFVPFCFPFANCYMPFSFTIGYTILAISASGCVLFAWFSSNGSNGSLSARGLAKIGLFSYSIYLWHMPFGIPIIRSLRNHLGDGLHLWNSGAFYAFLVLLYVAMAVMWGTVAYVLIEKPALALRNRWFPSRTSAAVPTTENQPAPNRPTDPYSSNRVPEITYQPAAA